MSAGKFVLHRFNGDEEFLLQSGTILAVHGCDGEGIRLWFEAETDGAAVRTLPDTEELHGCPRAEAAVILDRLDLNTLVGSRFSVPQGYDEVVQDHLGTIYYVEHEDLNNNELEIVAREGDIFHVRWSATTRDVNYYDGSKPDTTVEIEGKFQFEDIHKWA